MNPSRIDLLGEAWHTTGFAANKRFDEKMKSYENAYDMDSFVLEPLVMECSGRFHPRFEKVLKNVAAVASAARRVGFDNTLIQDKAFAFKWRSRITTAWFRRMAQEALSLQGRLFRERLGHNRMSLDFRDHYA